MRDDPPIDCERVWGFQVIDPRPCPDAFEHYKRADATMVCVSEWQAGLFRDMGFRATSIPVPIPDEWYGMARDPVPGRFVCVSKLEQGRPGHDRRVGNSWGSSRLAPRTPSRRTLTTSAGARG